MAESTVIVDTLYYVTIEDRVLMELHRAALDAGRRGIAVPSIDLERVTSGDLERDGASEAVRRLVRAGRVIRVRRDLLVLPEATGLAPTGLVDLVDAIAPLPYVITGGRALEHFGLTDQHYFGIAVLVPTEVAQLSFRGERATFYVTDPSNIWGAAPGQRPLFACPERAVIDALNHPRFGVSLTQAADALVRARTANSNFLDGLENAVRTYGAGQRRHGSRAAARRVGYVVEQLFGSVAAEPFLPLIGSNKAPVPLRPSGHRDGHVDTLWGIVVNARVESEFVQ
jgi:predicted transcriptional regulator of viral defense system